MFQIPMTRATAESHRYRKWAGRPKGTPYDPACCAYEVPDGGRSPLFHQCARRSGHGPEALFCKTHAKEAERRCAASKGG